MKKIMLVLVAIVLLSGCTHTLTKVQSEYGSPARVEIECIAGAVCDENTYYNNKDAVKYIYWFYYWKSGMWPFTTDQEYCWEVKADKNGKVISNREYVEQKGRAQLKGTPIEVRRYRKLPGAEK